MEQCEFPVPADKAQSSVGSACGVAPAVQPSSLQIHLGSELQDVVKPQRFQSHDHPFPIAQLSESASKLRSCHRAKWRKDTFRKGNVAKANLASKTTRFYLILLFERANHKAKQLSCVVLRETSVISARRDERGSVCNVDQMSVF